MSCIEVGVNTLTVWIWKEKVAPYMQLLHFAFGLGFFSISYIIILQKDFLHFLQLQLLQMLREKMKKKHLKYLIGQWLYSC